VPNNPVQIVLNTSNFIIRPEQPPGGSVKDFFAERDPEFAAHKSRLLGELDQIIERIDNLPDVGIEYAHVSLQSEAWAKTKRPMGAILRPENVPLIGGGNLGELLVELTAENVLTVRRAIEDAETEVKYAPDKENKLVPKPSRKRSEVGAIASIRSHEPIDRRGFSAQEAVSWFDDPRTGGLYIVETFAEIGEFPSARENRRPRAKAALERFTQQLAEVDLPIERVPPPPRWQGRRFVLLRLLSPEGLSREGCIALHQRLLEFLDHQPAVRRVLLPPLIEIGHAAHGDIGEIVEIAAPRNIGGYPVIGIIDTGVSPVGTLESWCAGRTNYVGPVGQDQSHGTFIAGLAVAASQLNAGLMYAEMPCKFFDLAMYPTTSTAFQTYYPNGFVDFLQQLDVELAAGKAAGVRVFNMSLALDRQVADGTYGIFASMIDAIVDGHDVLLVLPSGNLTNSLWRPEWPEGANEALKMLAEYRHTGRDRILEPAESIRSVVTGAVNPPSCATAALKPAVYTRRGPSAALGSKPDVAHIGGRGAPKHELVSIDVHGRSIEGCGTSYAAPLIARVLAGLNHQIEGDIERETLIAMLVHHAAIPEELLTENLKRVSRDFVGFGIPVPSAQMLETEDHQITLLFEGSLDANEELEFKFAWPASLVNGKGQCHGRARVTLVYRPLVDRSFDAEFVRINMDVYLRQEKVDLHTGEVSWKGRLRSESDKRYERELVEHGQKWWPVKKYEQAFMRVGSSSQWKLVVDGLVRAGSKFPDEGVPFSVLLTIEGSREESDVFRELRQELLAGGVTIADVRTANRISTRV
jgi:hypothetical protein